jgi:hypothetical protein
MTRTVSPSPEQLSDLVAKLRGPFDYDPGYMQDALLEAADALESAQAEIARLTTVSGDMVEEMARAICTLNNGGYCDCVGESLGCKVGRGEPPERSRCKMTAEALPLSAEYQMAQAAATIAKGRMEAIDGILAEAKRLILDGHPSRALLRVEEARAALKDRPNVG